MYDGLDMIDDSDLAELFFCGRRNYLDQMCFNSKLNVYINVYIMLRGGEENGFSLYSHDKENDR